MRTDECCCPRCRAIVFRSGSHVCWDGRVVELRAGRIFATHLPDATSVVLSPPEQRLADARYASAQRNGKERGGAQ